MSLGIEPKLDWQGKLSLFADSLNDREGDLAGLIEPKLGAAG
jgi:hypothetical protein